MNLLKLHTDADFANAVVPTGHLLIFFALDSNGTVVKRYKDSNGNFGTLAGERSSMSDTEAEEIITSHVTTAENDAQETQAYLVSSTAISTQLDSIIGE